MADQIALYNNETCNVEKNPLNNIEDVLSNHNWVYNRTRNDQIVVDLAGSACQYRLLFVWQPHMNALQLCCQYDAPVKQEHMPMAAQALMRMNESLWMGHFEITKETRLPCFRQTALLHGHTEKTGYACMEALLDIALTQCERFHAVFDLLSSDAPPDMDMLSFAMMETQGES